MSDGTITKLSDVVRITCVVAHGKGEDVVLAARGAGAGGALIHSARGAGVQERLGLLGIAVDVDKDVVTLLVGSDQAETVANIIYSAADLGRPGGGFMYLTPLESVAMYVPRELRDRLVEQGS